MLFISIFCAFTYYSSAQSGTYEISNLPAGEDINTYQEAMNQANFSSYHYQNQRRVLSFKSGVTIELLSLTELQNTGVDISNYNAAPSDRDNSHVSYWISSTGIIMEEHNTDHIKYKQ